MGEPILDEALDIEIAPDTEWLDKSEGVLLVRVVRATSDRVIYRHLSVPMNGDVWCPRDVFLSAYKQDEGSDRAITIPREGE